MENGNTELEWSKGQLPLATFDPLCASSALTEPGKLPKARRPRMRRLSFPAHHATKGYHITKRAERRAQAPAEVPLRLEGSTQWHHDARSRGPGSLSLACPESQSGMLREWKFPKTGTPRLSSSALRTRMDAFRGDSGVWACTGKRL